MSIVTLVSGGMDSTLMSLMAREEGIAIFPLFVDYGQLAAAKEWSTCKLLHEIHKLPEVMRMDTSGFGKVVPSGITSKELRVNEDAFLPGRNLLLLLCGAAYACTVQASGVAIGLLSPRDHLFPDQTREFLDQAESTIATAMGRRITVLTPLIELMKADVMAMLEKRAIRGTYSCHSGRDVFCGKCVACIEIARAKKRI